VVFKENMNAPIVEMLRMADIFLTRWIDDQWGLMIFWKNGKGRWRKCRKLLKFPLLTILKIGRGSWNFGKSGRANGGSAMNDKYFPRLPYRWSRKSCGILEKGKGPMGEMEWIAMFILTKYINDGARLTRFRLPCFKKCGLVFPNIPHEYYTWANEDVDST